jgi:hypothetical protein
LPLGGTDCKEGDLVHRLESEKTASDLHTLCPKLSSGWLTIKGTTNCSKEKVFACKIIRKNYILNPIVPKVTN